MKQESEIDFYGNLGFIVITIIFCVIFVAVAKLFF